MPTYTVTTVARFQHTDPDAIVKFATRHASFIGKLIEVTDVNTVGELKNAVERTIERSEPVDVYDMRLHVGSVGEMSPADDAVVAELLGDISRELILEFCLRPMEGAAEPQIEHSLEDILAGMQ